MAAADRISKWDRWFYATEGCVGVPFRAPDRDELLGRLLGKVEDQRIDIVVEVMLAQQRDGTWQTNVEPDGQRHVQLGKGALEKFVSVLQRGSETHLVWMVSGVPAGQARL